MSSCEESIQFCDVQTVSHGRFLTLGGFSLDKVLLSISKFSSYAVILRTALIYGKLAFSSVLLYSTKLDVIDNFS
jgi:hypothetical protein